MQTAPGVPLRAVVTTVPFAQFDPLPLRMLEEAGIGLSINPIGRRLKAEEVPGVVQGFPVIIAGTEPITAEAMAACPGLKAICRVGIGLDSVDLLAAQRLGIAVSYTPSAPSPAVAELAVGLMLDCLRGVAQADDGLRHGQWQRISGRRLSCCKVGIIGVGRIGRKVIDHLRLAFPGVEILANDLKPDTSIPDVTWVEKDEIYRSCDVVSLHLPLTAVTRDMISTDQLVMMRSDAVLINTARGGIVDEAALADALRRGVILRAAVDVFTEEPYTGELTGIPNVVLTCHMGSMTADCRARMEIEATAEAVRFLKGEPFATPVPDSEYLLARQMAGV